MKTWNINLADPAGKWERQEYTVQAPDIDEAIQLAKAHAKEEGVARPLVMGFSEKKDE